MNGKKAKKIRRRVYEDFSIRDRSYTIGQQDKVIRADWRRQEYQRLKKVVSR